MRACTATYQDCNGRVATALLALSPLAERRPARLALRGRISLRRAAVPVCHVPRVCTAMRRACAGRVATALPALSPLAERRPARLALLGRISLRRAAVPVCHVPQVCIAMRRACAGRVATALLALSLRAMRPVRLALHVRLGITAL